jgi:hypothetical protein
LNFPEKICSPKKPKERKSKKKIKRESFWKSKEAGQKGIKNKGKRKTKANKEMVFIWRKRGKNSIFLL